MKITRFTFVIVVLAGVVSCQFTPNRPQDTPAKNVKDACGASALQVLVGMRASEIDLKDHKGDVRIIGPDTAVTMDYVPERLNISTDANGAIKRITCG